MRKSLLLLCVTLLVSACGFHLRGNYSLPFDTLYIDLPETTELYASLKRNIETGTKTLVTDDRQTADAILSVVSDRTSQSILSIGADGRVTEYQLIRVFSFRVFSPAGEEIIPQREISLTRALPYSDNTVLAKASESDQLLRDMQADLVQQIMRRLAAANRAKNAAAGGGTTGNATAR